MSFIKYVDKTYVWSTAKIKVLTRADDELLFIQIQSCKVSTKVDALAYALSIAKINALIGANDEVSIRVDALAPITIWNKASVNTSFVTESEIHKVANC